MTLFSVNADAKTVKGSPLGYMTAILYLVPSDRSGLGNLCPNASPECKALCLFDAGRGVMRPVIAGRQRKTAAFFAGTAKFVDQASAEIDRLRRTAERKGLTLCVRLNGTSDVLWERLKGTDGRTLFERHPDVQFYDYTKRPNRAVPANYHLTFSRSETNEPLALAALAEGTNVAVVFDTPKGCDLPATWFGYTVIDGDAHDLRFTDPSGVVVGLRAKGPAKHATNGFVVNANSPACKAVA